MSLDGQPREPSDQSHDEVRTPLRIAQVRSDHFPTTRLTTLLDGLRCGNLADTHTQLAATIMERYAEPLAIYAAGSSLREIAEPADLVHGFFASALADPSYFTRYQSSGMRMRRWLMNGLLLHARSVARDRVRHHRREGAPIDATTRAGEVPSSEAAYHRAWALALLSEACTSVEAALVAEGRDRAWTVFRRHAIDGRSYIDLEHELGLGRQQMADLVRGVTKRLRLRILELLRIEGGDPAEELREVLRLLT
ncbi:MAG: hypothetical protein RL136_58 [Planctomycetota bacterium]